MSCSKHSETASKRPVGIWPKVDLGNQIDDDGEDMIPLSVLRGHLQLLGALTFEDFVGIRGGD